MCGLFSQWYDPQSLACVLPLNDPFKSVNLLLLLLSMQTVFACVWEGHIRFSLLKGALLSNVHRPTLLAGDSLQLEEGVGALTLTTGSSFQGQ